MKIYAYNSDGTKLIASINCNQLSSDVLGTIELDMKKRLIPDEFEKNRDSFGGYDKTKYVCAYIELLSYYAHIVGIWKHSKSNKLAKAVEEIITLINNSKKVLSYRWEYPLINFEYKLLISFKQLRKCRMKTRKNKS